MSSTRIRQNGRRRIGFEESSNSPSPAPHQITGNTLIDTTVVADSPPANLPVARQGSLFYLIWVCFVASIGGFLFGYDTAVISGTFEFVEKQFALTKVEVGWFGSAALFGCILGAAMAGWLSDRYGRRPVLLWSGLFFFVSALYCMIPESFGVLVLARALGGLGVGMASVVAPMYISEFSPPRVRGRIGALYQVSIGIGILAAYSANYLLLKYGQGTNTTPGEAGFLHFYLVTEVWRGMFGMEMIPAGLFALLLLFVPESPRFLVKAGREERALAILARIDGCEMASRELREIRTSMEHEEGKLKELFRPGLRKALLLGLGLAFFGQFTGVNIVIYYGPTILREAGLESGSALLYQVVLGSIGLFFTLIAVTRIDSWGRRPLLVGGMVLVALSMFATAILMLVGAPAIWVVVLLGVYMACLALSICTVIWVLTPEIFPNRVRGRGTSISTFMTWSANAFTAFVFPWYVTQFGLAAGFFTFAAICTVATVFFWRLTPETRGKSLEEIELFFGRAETRD